jgi:medium-chain acyl-[acyl-carrier-protein] hydrolase
MLIPSSQRTTQALSPWLVFPNPRPQAKLRLFCFPYAGAGAAAYRTWLAGLPPQVEVVSLLYPGRDSRLREAPFVSIQPLVQALQDEMGPYLDYPFAFYGHSLGGLVAYHLACTLRARGLPQPVHLFVSSRRAPHLPDLYPPTHALADDAFAEAIQQRYGGIPAVIRQDPELMALFLPILRADFSILETYHYRPEPAFDFPISVFGGLQDTTVKQDDLAAWRQHTQRGFTLRMFPGDHFYLQNQRKSLLQAISQGLADSNL